MEPLTLIQMKCHPDSRRPGWRVALQPSEYGSLSSRDAKPARCLLHMRSMDDLLHLLHSDGADELRLHVGQPPIIVLEGEPEPLEAPAITTEDAQQLWHSIANTRQRRELREQGSVEFIYRFRGRADFVVHARLEDENVGMDIH